MKDIKVALFKISNPDSLRVKLLNSTVLRTNKGQTNKGQNTFFKKIYSGLIRDKS